MKNNGYKRVDVLFKSEITGKRELVEGIYLLNGDKNLNSYHFSTDKSGNIFSVEYIIPISNIIEMLAHVEANHHTDFFG